MANPVLGQDALERLRTLLVERRAGSSTFAIVDAAADPDALDRLYASRTAQFDVLWSGDPEPDVFEVSPFLVDYSADPSLADWLLEGWGAARAVFVGTRLSFDAAHRHLRRFTEAVDPHGRVVVCRYYDPVVLPDLLAVLDLEQLRDVFLGIDEFIIDDASSAGIVRISLGPERLEVWREKLPDASGIAEDADEGEGNAVRSALG